MSDDKVKELQEQIADLKKRWPAHSTPPAMMEQLDELEEQLKREISSSENTSTEERTFRLRAIGYVENEFDEPTTPSEIRSVESRIVL